MKKYYFFLVSLAVIFFVLLGGLAENIATRNGGTMFMTFAGLWLVGTMIRVYWKKIKFQLESKPEEDISMDTEV